jgi:NAD(P)-dependent dehydrogenase (short-subunit alcohol dehydrogenase family)
MESANGNKVTQCAIVVGGGRGLGRAIAKLLGREGYSVVVAARTQSEIDSVAAEITAHNGKALAVRTDASRPEQVTALVAAAMQQCGRIDVLVNCAGEAFIKPTIENKFEDFIRLISSNLATVWLTCHAVLPQMVKQKRGHIVNVSSRVALNGAPEVAAFSAAKAGVVGLSKALALEFKGNNIKVSAICPSPMNTKMRWDATPNMDRTKVIQPERVAELVALLVANPDMTIDEVYPTSVHL